MLEKMLGWLGVTPGAAAVIAALAQLFVIWVLASIAGVDLPWSNRNTSVAFGVLLGVNELLRRVSVKAARIASANMHKAHRARDGYRNASMKMMELIGVRAPELYNSAEALFRESEDLIHRETLPEKRHE